MPVDTFCAISFSPVAVNPLGDVYVFCKNGNSFPNLINTSEAPGNKLWSLPVIVE